MYDIIKGKQQRHIAVLIINTGEKIRVNENSTSLFRNYVFHGLLCDKYKQSKRYS